LIAAIYLLGIIAKNDVHARFLADTQLLDLGLRYNIRTGIVKRLSFFESLELVNTRGLRKCG
jgi:hypothetical protein